MANRRNRETIQLLEDVALSALGLACSLFCVSYEDECMIEYDSGEDAFKIMLYGLYWDDGIVDERISLKGKSVREACRLIFRRIINYEPEYGKHGRPHRRQPLDYEGKPIYEDDDD